MLADVEVYDVRLHDEGMAAQWQQLVPSSLVARKLARGCKCSSQDVDYIKRLEPCDYHEHEDKDERDECPRADDCF